MGYMTCSLQGEGAGARRLGFGKAALLALATIALGASLAGSCLLAPVALAAEEDASAVAAASGASAAADADGSSDAADASDASGTDFLAELLSMEVEGMEWDPAALQEAQALNSDVYAWLYVPGTNVNRPVLQGGGDDDFYLSHDIYGNASAIGEPYSQYSFNTTTFNDPITLIYGHTFEFSSGLGEEAFGSLHNFEDAAFFDSHPYMYVFLPNAVLKYKIVSAYEYENRHILYGHDYTVKSALQHYYDYVVNPVSDVVNVRAGERPIAGETRLVQLATCTRPANDAYRFLVTGMLVDGRPL